MIAASYAVDFLRMLAAAVAARQLYPADHPRVVAAISDACKRAVDLVDDRESLSIFTAEDRLTFGGQSIAAGPTALRIFESLAALGHDRMTISPGITTAEVEGLVTALAAVALDERAASRVGLVSSAHLHFAALETRLHSGRDGHLTPGSPEYAQQLSAVWRGIDRDRLVDVDALEQLVVPLVEIATRHGDTLVPLARLEAHDAYTAAHISNVALLSTVLAQAMGFPVSAIHDVGVAALLHDIGKLRIPEAVLNSRERLNPEELALVRQHPEIGARLLTATPGVPSLAPIVAYEHHLQAGGGGYPSVPRGWAIHPASAITHVADVYDALRTNRPYRRALEHEQILDMMLRDRTSVFDEDVLDAFFEHVVPLTDPGQRAEAAPDGVV